MITVPLDPHLLVIDATDSEKAQLVTESVLSWSTLRDYPQFTLCISQKTLEALIEDHKLPVYSELVRVLTLLEFEQADAYTVAQTMMFFVSNSAELESVLGISDVLFAPGFSCGSTCQCAMMPKTCAEAKRMMGMLGLRQQLGFGNDIRLAHAAAVPIVSLHISGTVELADVTHAVVEFPFDVDQQIVACSNADVLLKSLNSLAIWLNAETEGDLILAIRAAAENLKQQSTKTRTVEIGTRFKATMTSLHFDQDSGKASRLLGACAEVAVNSNLRQIHAIRTSKTGNAPQLCSGKSKAWRKDIDNEFHLHYWELENGGLRLASVVPHSDFSISW